MHLNGEEICLYGDICHPFGPHAYRDYAGRNHALGIDLYANIRYFADRLVYFSPSELIWFGLEQLPYGFNEFERLPDLRDGIFFNGYKESQPGIYIERLPPYTGTLNPGFDTNLPEYVPLATYEAMRDALTFDSAYDSKWSVAVPPVPAPPTYEKRYAASYLGSESSPEYNALLYAGLTFSPDGENAVIDIHYCSDNTSEGIFRGVADKLQKIARIGGTALVIITDEADLPIINNLLPHSLLLTERPATMLKRQNSHPWVDSLAIDDMYFAEGRDKYILLHGMEGELCEQGKVLLSAADTDWSLFNNVAEYTKCGAVIMYEQHKKRSGAALVMLPYGNGIIAVTTLRIS